MAIAINGQSRRIALALSGDGFRAAAFHLGVMRKLQSLGLFSAVDLLSCVSGGSIAGAFVALNWGKPAVLDEQENYLATRSIAVSSAIGGILDPFESRLDKLAQTYDRYLFKGASLSALRTGARLCLNVTNLSTGNLFFFVAGGSGLEEMGEHELGVVGAANFSLARAVAASSAFPPVFPPMRVEAPEYAPASQVDYVTLTDGGIYDNMGVNPSLRARNAIDYLIVSDGGKPFANDAQPTESGGMVLKAALDIMMEQIRGLEFDRMRHRHKAGVGPKPMWFSIDSILGEAQAGAAQFASAIKTKLSALNAAERAVLVRRFGTCGATRLIPVCRCGWRRLRSTTRLSRSRGKATTRTRSPSMNRLPT